MGFFSKVGGAVSGRTYKYNTLIGSNVNRITGRVSGLPDTDFVKDWVYAAVFCADKTLETLFFSKEIQSEKKGFVDFKSNMHLFDEQKVLLCFKLLGGFYLFVFLKNDKNREFLDEAGLSKKDFENKVFEAFEFDQNDKTLYKKLTSDYGEKVADYPLGLWHEIAKQCFGAKNAYLGSGVAFALIVFNIYKDIFYSTLKHLMGRHL